MEKGCWENSTEDLGKLPSNRPRLKSEARFMLTRERNERCLEKKDEESAAQETAQRFKRG